jgi:hypothetical protein
VLIISLFLNVFRELLLLQCVEHEFLILKTTELFNRLTYITLEINLGNLKEANLALCLFQHAPNLRNINLKVQLMRSLTCYIL